MAFKEMLMKWRVIPNKKKIGIIGGIAIGVIAIIAIPTTMVLTGRNKNNNLIVWVPWSKDSIQSKTLRDIVEVYNYSHEGKYDLELIYMNEAYKESGYTEIVNLMEKNINSGKKGVEKLPDIYINNQDAVSVLQTWGNKEYAINLEENGLNTENLIESTLINNIVGIEEGEIYGIPSITTQSIGIDSPLLIWMLQELENNGVTLNISGSTMKFVADAADGTKDNSIYTSVSEIEIQEEDRANIESKWTLETDLLLDSGITSITINDDTFDNADLLADLGNTLSEVFRVDGGKKLSETSSYGITGFTNPQSEFMTLTQSLLGEEDMITISSNNDGLIYNFVHEGTPQYEAASEIFDIFQGALKTGSFWYPSANQAYSSSLISAHQLVFTVGSTSGVSYNQTTPENGTLENHNSENLDIDEIVYIDDMSGITTSTKRIYKQQGPSFGAAKRGLSDQYERTEAIIEFFNWFISDEVVNIQGEELTPSQYFSKYSGYVVGTTSATDESFKSEFTSDNIQLSLNEDGEYETKDVNSFGPSIIYDVIDQTSDSSVEFMTEPSEKYTAVFWQEVQSLFKYDQQSLIDNNEVGFTNGSEDFLQELEDKIQTNGWESTSKNITHNFIIDIRRKERINY